MNGGLINSTWSVGEPPRAVVQRLHSIFQPEVNEDINAITAHLEARGMPTPRLIPTDAGALSWVDQDDRCWRALSWVPGKSYDSLSDPQMAAEAGALVARWHLATADLDHKFVFQRPAGHDTVAHMKRLQQTLQERQEHPLWSEISALAESIFKAWDSWEGSLEMPRLLAHGDLKISNLRFTDQGLGHCLLDLDTLAMLPLDAELGDAWRSWCNRAGEDQETSNFDLELFKASAQAYLAVRPVGAEELEALPGGIERICLELSSRFATDALREDFFGWDNKIAPSHGEHSLLRARGQFSLADSVRSQRLQIEGLLH
ncbi:MAG: hypothetical protein CMP23_01455 [Rickettsiales bacterium]|nr:hypothetical protein [Rickettsiales bacterium]